MTSGIKLYDFVMGGMQRIKKADLLVLGFGIVPRLSYQAEIEGDDTIFSEICAISDALQCVCLAAADTDLYGVYRKSIVVADNGKLINITDMINIPDNGIYTAGAEFNVYRTGCGKVGVLVDNDIFFDNSEILCNTGCDFVVAAVDCDFSERVRLAVQSNALNRCSVFCTARDCSVLADNNGNIIKEERGILEFIY